MEKQYRSNGSFLVINHLPRIFNMLQILNMMVYGFVVNQPVYFISAISSLQKSIRLLPYRQLKKRLGKQLLFCLKNIYYFLVTVILQLLLLANSSAINVIVALLALLSLGTQLLYIYKSSNRVMYTRSFTIRRAQLKNYRERWFFYNHSYKIADFLAFAGTLLAMISV